LLIVLLLVNHWEKCAPCLAKYFKLDNFIADWNNGDTENVVLNIPNL